MNRKSICHISLGILIQGIVAHLIERKTIFFLLLGIIPGDQEGLFKLAVQLKKIFNSVIYNTATGCVLLVYLTNI
jgi:hypothetical protein